MAEREQKRRPAPAPSEETVEELPAPTKQGEKLKAELDELLDEIDEVLEDNAEEFVRADIQKGGQYRPGRARPAPVTAFRSENHPAVSKTPPRGLRDRRTPAQSSGRAQVQFSVAMLQPLQVTRPSWLRPTPAPHFEQTPSLGTLGRLIFRSSLLVLTSSLPGSGCR